MTQEEKELLLKDLCARLPYGVKVRIEGDWFYDEREPYDTVLKSEVLGHLIADMYSVKPYLRPMSSMTEEEKIKFRTLRFNERIGNEFGLSLDYLNSIHIDYRGLIPMGLAIEAPEGMYDN